MLVIGISGSLRTESYNSALLRAAVELAPAEMEIRIADIASIPFYNEDVRAVAMPEAVSGLKAEIKRANGVLFCTPEYNRSIPGVLKNAIDWLSRGHDKAFDGKAVAIMGASRGLIGTALANYHLRQILSYLNAQILNGPEVLVGGAPGKIDANGHLVDEKTRAFVAEHLRRLARLMEVCICMDSKGRQE